MQTSKQNSKIGWTKANINENSNKKYKEIQQICKKQSKLQKIWTQATKQKQKTIDNKEAATKGKNNQSTKKHN